MKDKFTKKYIKLKSADNSLDVYVKKDSIKSFFDRNGTIYVFFGDCGGHCYYKGSLEELIAELNY